jgi:hypothetical protein
MRWRLLRLGDAFAVALTKDKGPDFGRLLLPPLAPLPFFPGRAASYSSASRICARHSIMELAEIDENLIRFDLTPAERAMHTRARKKVYERLHPETKHGAACRTAPARPRATA